MKKLTILFAVLVIVAVGCGKEGALDSVSAPGESAAPTTTTTKPGGGTAAALSTAAPTGAPAEPRAPAAAATTRPAAAAAPLSEAALEKTLLSDSELSGWSRSRDGGSGSESEGDFEPCGKSEDDAKHKAAHEADRNYSKGQVGDQLGLHNESYVSANEAHLSIEEGKKEIKDCPTWTHTEDDGTKITFTAKEQSFPNLGDETAAFRITFTGSSPSAPTFKIKGDGLIVVVRLGQNIVSVAHMAIAVNSEPQLDTAETERLTRKAVDKFKRTT